jgi:hypothetical protein
VTNRVLLQRCVGCGLGFGVGSAVWIVLSHRQPSLAPHYHMPLAE